METKVKLSSRHILPAFLAVVLGVSVTSTVLNIYTHYIDAQEYVTFRYLSGNRDAAGNLVAPDCPKFQVFSREADFRYRVIKETCTNTYWPYFDLPHYDSSGNRHAYTWDEAKRYCENLAVYNDGVRDVNILRLPTVDELLALTQLPCQDPDTCSFLTAVNNADPRYKSTVAGKTFKSQATPAAQVELFSYGKDYAYSGIADGAYWADGEIVIDQDDVDARSSVNVKYGTVNNPLYGKDVRLNVRCVFDMPIQTRSFSDPQSVDWNMQLMDLGSSVDPRRHEATKKVLYRTGVKCDDNADCGSSAPYSYCEAANDVNVTWGRTQRYCSYITSDTIRATTIGCNTPASNDWKFFSSYEDPTGQDPNKPYGNNPFDCVTPESSPTN